MKAVAKDKGSGFAAVRAAFANRNFRLYTAGNVGSHVGTWMQRTAVGWLTWQLTGSAFWLGAIALADVAPIVVLAPLTGAVADRVERIHAIKVTQSLAMLQAAALAGLTFTGLITIELLFALTLALGVVMAFNQPLRLAITPGLVGRKDLAAAIGINSLSFNVSRAVGPALAGPVIAHWGVAPCFAFNAVSYVAFLAALFMMRGAAEARIAPAQPFRNVPAEIMEGVLYCARHAGIAPLFLMVAVTAVLGRAYSELLPGFAAEVFGRGSGGFALLLSSLGAGAMVAGVVMAGRGSVEGLTRVVVRSVLVLALAVLAFTVAPSFWIGMGAIAVAGFAAITCSVGQQTLLQSALAPGIRGRVMSLYGMIMRGGPALGALLMGTLHGALGLRWPVLAGATVCLGLWVWAVRRQQRMAAALEGGGGS